MPRFLSKEFLCPALTIFSRGGIIPLNGAPLRRAVRGGCAGALGGSRKRYGMGNFIFLSPNFPEGYWRFCAALKARGFCVLGIGDCPYDALRPELKGVGFFT